MIRQADLKFRQVHSAVDENTFGQILLPIGTNAFYKRDNYTKGCMWSELSGDTTSCYTSNLDKYIWQLRKDTFSYLDKYIPHICHFLYTGRIFKFKILHLEITQIYPKKVKYVVFLRSIWKNLHPTEFFTRAAPVVPVTNMRYALNTEHKEYRKNKVSGLMMIIKRHQSSESVKCH